MEKSESGRLDNKNEKELINLLDVALSTHIFMRDRKPDGLDGHFDALRKKIRELSDKVWFQYIDWKDQARKEGKKWAKKFGRVVSKNIGNLGVQKGLMQVCGDNPTEEQKKYEKHLQALEDDFVKQNKEKIAHFNNKHLSEYLKILEESKKKIKDYITLFERIKEIYNEYKSRIDNSPVPDHDSLKKNIKEQRERADEFNRLKKEKKDKQKAFNEVRKSLKQKSVKTDPRYKEIILKRREIKEISTKLKELKNEYKGKQTNSGIFKSADEENPSKFRADYQGKVIRDYMEDYISWATSYIENNNYDKPDIMIDQENYANEIIYGNPYTDSRPGQSFHRDDEFRPTTPDFDPGSEVDTPVFGGKSSRKKTRRRRRKLKKKTKRRKKRKRRTRKKCKRRRRK